MTPSNSKPSSGSPSRLKIVGNAAAIEAALRKAAEAAARRKAAG